MRPIKFRAWYKPRREMLEVTMLQWSAADPSKWERMEVFRLVERNAGLTRMVHGDDTIRNNYILMQYTGLKDKDGREIYEGDILKIEDATAQVVFWEIPPEFGLGFHHNEDKWCEDWNLSDDSDRMEIIGNIYENPEIVSNIGR